MAKQHELTHKATSVMLAHVVAPPQPRYELLSVQKQVVQGAKHKQPNKITNIDTTLQLRFQLSHSSVCCFCR